MHEAIPTPCITMLPENLVRLHQHEEEIRRLSLEALYEDDELVSHVWTIEASADLINYFMRRPDPASDDERTVQLLGVRLFNGTAGALKLLLSGYYQLAGLQLRDILETSFLLDYFSSCPASIPLWRNCDERTRLKTFSPFELRTFLDNRDGFKDQKRREAYKNLSLLAGHPTYAGFRMLRGEASGGAFPGPFFHLGSARALTQELVKLTLHAALTYCSLFVDRTRYDVEAKMILFEAEAAWSARFAGRPANREQLDQIRRILTAAVHEAGNTESA